MTAPDQCQAPHCTARPTVRVDVSHLSATEYSELFLCHDHAEELTGEELEPHDHPPIG